MGRCPNNKAGGRQKKYTHKQARRTKFLKKDMIFDELHKKKDVQDAPAPAAAAEEERSETVDPEDLDEDRPGMGRWYCLVCDRDFATEAVREVHLKSKQHKRRVKLMKGQRPHCQLDADLAGGMGRPDNGKRRDEARLMQL